MSSEPPGRARPDVLGDIAVLAGRLLLAALFAAGAAQKFLDPQPVMTLLAGRGWPVLLVWPALAFDAIGAGILILGLANAPTALALSLYCMVTSLFHWVPSDPWQMSIFVKNWAIAGGLLVLAAHGPGRFAFRLPLRSRLT